MNQSVHYNYIFFFKWQDNTWNRRNKFIAIWCLNSATLTAKVSEHLVPIVWTHNAPNESTGPIKGETITMQQLAKQCKKCPHFLCSIQQEGSGFQKVKSLPSFPLPHPLPYVPTFQSLRSPPLLHPCQVPRCRMASRASEQTPRPTLSPSWGFHCVLAV